MTSGSCLCGDVRFRIDGAFTRMSHCHCSMCRKAHGAPFATYAGARASDFHWISGEERIVYYESSPGYPRAFCPRCGSVVPHAGGSGDMLVPAGCLDDDPGIRPERHIFVASKAPWHVVADDLPRSDAYPAGRTDAVIERPGPADAPPAGTLRGSCLCGAVAYVVIAPIKGVHNCHCSRCRKARAAAHATNGFTDADGVRFVRGEDRITLYKCPDARFFTVAFCRECGSGVPRIDRERGIAVIPFGSLDDDPGRGADDHIYVGSKASWYEITDDLPRYEERPSG